MIKWEVGKSETLRGRGQNVRGSEKGKKKGGMEIDAPQVWIIIRTIREGGKKGRNGKKDRQQRDQEEQGVKTERGESAYYRLVVIDDIPDAIKYLYHLFSPTHSTM